jgi:N-sulfoglucosamine sulfohydrolase
MAKRNPITELSAQDKLTSTQAVLAAPSMPPEEFYDLEDDPHEIQNLVDSDDPAIQAALKRLRAELGRWIEESNDQGRIPEPAEVAAAKGATKPSR